MDWSAILAGLGMLATVGCGVMGWYVNGVRDDLKEVKADVADQSSKHADFREKVAREYVPHSRFDFTVAEINRKLDTIIGALADKADRA